MSMLRIASLLGLLAAFVVAQDSDDRTLLTRAAVEQQILAAIKSSDLTVVHLWAPWCSNCQAELKNGGWTKIVKDNPNVKFNFVSVWNDGQDGRAMLKKFNIADQSNVKFLQ